MDWEAGGEGDGHRGARKKGATRNMQTYVCMYVASGTDERARRIFFLCSNICNSKRRMAMGSELRPAHGGREKTTGDQRHTYGATGCKRGPVEPAKPGEGARIADSTQQEKQTNKNLRSKAHIWCHRPAIAEPVEPSKPGEGPV